MKEYKGKCSDCGGKIYKEPSSFEECNLCGARGMGLTMSKDNKYYSLNTFDDYLTAYKDNIDNTWLFCAVMVRIKNDDRLRDVISLIKRKKPDKLRIYTRNMLLPKSKGNYSMLNTLYHHFEHDDDIRFDILSEMLNIAKKQDSSSKYKEIKSRAEYHGYDGIVEICENGMNN